MAEEQIILEFIPDTSMLDKSLDEVAKGITDQLGKVGNKDFLKGVADGIREEIDKLSKAIQGVTKSEKEAKKELDAFAKSMNHLAQGVAGGAIKQGTENLTKIGTEVNKAAGETTKLTAQLRAMREQLARLDEGSAEFQALSIEAAKLQDRINNVNERIRTLSKSTFAVDAVVDSARAVAGAFAVAQGTAALFGDENEDLQKTLLKVQGSLAILNGLQETANFITGQSAGKLALLAAAQKGYNFVVNASTGALRLFNTALLATGAGAIIAGLGLIVAYWEDIAKFIGIAADEQDRFTKNKARQDYLDSLGKEAQKLFEIRKAEEDTREGGINDLKRQLELVKATGATRETIFAVEQAIRQKELEQLERFRRTEEQTILQTRTGLLDIAKLEDEIANRKNEIQVERIKFLNESLKVQSEVIKNEIRNIEALTEAAKDLKIDAPLIDTSDLTADPATIEKPFIEAGAMAGEAFKDSFINRVKNAFDDPQELKEALKDFAVATFSEISDFGFNISEERRQREFEAEIDALEKRREIELSNKELTESQKLAIDKRYRKEETELRRRQFEAEKKVKIAEIISNAAVASLTLLRTTPPTILGAPNPAYIAAQALIGIKTALSIASVSATKFPGFKKGTKNAPGGMALVGEEGAELMHVPKGAKIVPHAETVKILSGHPDTNDILSRFNIPITSAKVDTLKKDFAGYDFTRLERLLAKNTGQFPQVHFDKNGIVTLVNSENSRRTYLGNRYSSR